MIMESERFSVCCVQVDEREHGAGERDGIIAKQRAKAQGPGALTSKGRRCLSQLQEEGQFTPLWCFCSIRVCSQC